MKKLVHCLTPALLAVPLFLHAQSTTYFSNVGLSSSLQRSIASDSWAAGYFTTGSAEAGYSLQSIQLLMLNSSRSPTGLSVSLWDFQTDQPILALSGPDPTSAGLYTYTASDFVMPPKHQYWFVVTSQTPAATGAFHWSYTANQVPIYPPKWQGGGYYVSSDGLNWTRTPAAPDFQFSVNATLIPEPSVRWLLGLGALIAAVPWCKRALGAQ